MRLAAALPISALLFLPAADTSALAAGAAARLKQRLRGVAARNYALPGDADPFPLALEMTAHIGATDPELRDELIWRTYKTWIVERGLFDPAQLRRLLAAVTDEAHLFLRLGERGDSVFTRAFSVLVVEQILVAHRRAPFLSAAELARVKRDLARYVEGERDLRGYVEGKGWAHAVAHAADALDQLAQCDELGRDDLLAILALIRAKVSVSESAYVHGEDERLVTAALSAIRRRALTDAEVAQWIRSVAAHDRKEWSPQNHQTLNKKSFLRSLYFRARRHEELRYVEQPIEQALAELGDDA